jgi:hypothetical protein
MTSDQELRELIAFARVQGAVVEIGCDFKAWAEEGRVLIETVRVSGLPGVGPHPMASIAAAETLRRYVGTVLTITDRGTLEAVREYMTSNVRKNSAHE